MEISVFISPVVLMQIGDHVARGQVRDEGGVVLGVLMGKERDDDEGVVVTTAYGVSLKNEEDMFSVLSISEDHVVGLYAFQPGSTPTYPLHLLSNLTPKISNRLHPRLSSTGPIHLLSHPHISPSSTMYMAQKPHPYTLLTTPLTSTALTTLRHYPPGAMAHMIAYRHALSTLREKLVCLGGMPEDPAMRREMLALAVTLGLVEPGDKDTFEKEVHLRSRPIEVVNMASQLVTTVESIRTGLLASRAKNTIQEPDLGKQPPRKSKGKSRA